ncbi:MAG TPA: VOC family protein [Caulobacteraceae bacterium]|jgi:catechol 2,3-dioxygenase-like lactoylglutathione lyase family enzyme
MLEAMDAMATVPVKDLARARPFYEGVLGLKPIGGQEMGVQGYRAGKTTVLVYQSEFAGTNKATTVTWSLGDDFDGVVEDLREKDVVFEQYEMPGTTYDNGVHVMGEMRVAWFKDPDGNIINIGNYPMK